MNPSRIVSGIAALAIGFAITLVGVAAQDDTTSANDAPAGQEASDSPPDDEIFEDDDVDLSDEGDEGEEPDEAQQSEVEADEPDPAEVEVPVPSEPPVTEPATTVTTAPPGNNSRPVDEPSDSTQFECVDTITILYDNGDEEDAVVGEQLADDAWLIFTPDGEFVVSLDDDEVIDVRENRRVVSFDDGGIDFLGGCEVLGEIGDSTSGSSGSSPDGGSDPQLERSSAVFPCSDQALVDFRQVVGAGDIFADSEVEEFQLLLAIRLGQLGGRIADDWFVSLDDQFNGFRTFPNGCPLVVENGFTQEGAFCAAGRVSADERLIAFLRTAVPTVMVGCTYDLGQDGGN